MTDITVAEKEILAAIDASREAILEDLVMLVRIPSLVGEEGPIQTHMEDRLRQAGMGKAVHDVVVMGGDQDGRAMTVELFEKIHDARADIFRLQERL